MSDVLDEQAVWVVPDRGDYRARNAVRMVSIEHAREAVQRAEQHTAGLTRAIVAGALLPFTDHKFRDGKPCMVGSDKGCTCGYYEALKTADGPPVSEASDE